MEYITHQSGISTSKIGFAEKPLRAEPGHSPGEVFRYTPRERAAIVEEAIVSGIDFFMAAHERDAASLADSIADLGCRDGIVLAATEGDFLDRCDDSEDDAFRAVEAAIARKLTLLRTDRLDIFLIYDFRAGTHTPARLAGARQALEDACAAGTIRAFGATCYNDLDALSDAIQTEAFAPDIVIARMNAFDREASRTLIPACTEKHIAFYAAQPFAWVGGVPFPRFPNAWRLRNMTMNFFDQTVGQAHLRWLLAQPGVDGAMISMNEAGQPRENASAFKGATLPPPPNAVESLFTSFREAITGTDEGWTGLLEDPLWEIRQSAEEYFALHRR